MYRIENELIAITVSPTGAEMQTLTARATGRELLWGGDARYWSGRSPILFPAVGGLWNGVYRHQGREVAMPKHGFLRTAPWSLAEQTPTSLTFAHELQEGERACFPWRYRAEVCYRLEGARVVATFRVKNLDDEPLYFQMGGHPGFALPDFREDCPVSGYLRLEGKPTGLLRAGLQGCTEAQRQPVPADGEGLIPLCVDTFAHEALIFDAHQISAATLLDVQRAPIATVRSTAPVWLFWMPQGVHAPFVCAEPWYGLCDPIGFAGTLAQRPYINALPAGETWTGGYEIEVHAGL